MEKVYCCERPQDNSALWAAISNKGRDGDMWNNPMMYLVWMWVMRYMNGTWGENGFGAENFNSRAISQLQSTVDNNHNNDLAMAAIKGNASAIAELASAMNVNFNTMSQAICGIKSAIEQVGGQVGFSAERVINAVNMGDCNVIQALKDCCCNTQKAILEMGYQNQLQIKDLQNALMGRIDGISTGIQTGFAQVGYANAQAKAEIMQHSDANTQRILDVMCQNQTQALRDLLAQKDRELQSQSIVNQLRGTFNPSCSCS